MLLEENQNPNYTVKAHTSPIIPHSVPNSHNTTGLHSGRVLGHKGTSSLVTACQFLKASSPGSGYHQPLGDNAPTRCGQPVPFILEGAASCVRSMEPVISGLYGSHLVPVFVVLWFLFFSLACSSRVLCRPMLFLQAILPCFR